MDRSPAEQELNRIERELDANDPTGGKPPVRRGGGKDGGGQSGKSGNRSLDAVLVTALLLFVVAVARQAVFCSREKTPRQRPLSSREENDTR